MKKSLLLFVLLLIGTLSNSVFEPAAYANPAFFAPAISYPGFPEGFESGTKPAYTYGTVSLTTGDWAMDDALIGTSTSDRKSGAQSVRIRNTGKLSMLFDLTGGASKVTVQHGLYGSDTTGTWGLWYSRDGGSTWAQAASDVSTTTTTLNQTTFALALYGNVRFEIRKVSGGRINIDNMSVTDISGICCCGCSSVNTDTIPTQDDNLTMGNPSGATASTMDSNNYLIVKHQFALSYNNSKGMANWVSWHLSRAWKGAAPRCDCFTQDATLPTGYYKATTSQYTSTGFDRGHLCPSDDRDLSDTDNAATFKMTNISPQAPQMNQITWGNLEDYCRTLIYQGYELYIIAGAYGTGGSGSLGGTTNTIASGKINVPSNYWKIIVVLPVGTNDISRVSTGTRIIAVDMPNVQSVTDHSWDYYRTTTNAIEINTGFDFLSLVPDSVQAVIEATADTVTIF
jgi:endonuclease G, mitochondrial